MDIDDIIDSWCAGYEAAWQGPGPVPDIGFNKIQYHDDRLEIVRLANRSAPPLHKGFKLGNTKNSSGADIAAIMLDIRTGHEIVDDAHAKRDHIASLCATSGMSINSWHVCDVYRDGTDMRSTIYLEINAHNAAGTQQPHDFLVGERWGRFGLSEIRKLAKLQQARKAITNAPFTIDPILLKALHTLQPAELVRLEAHLRRHPTVPLEDRGIAMQANWDRPSLARYGCRLPDGVETIIVKKGVISGRVRLAPGTTWTAGALVHAEGLPHTLTISLIDRHLTELVEHADIDPRLIIKTAVIDKRGALRVKTKPLTQMLNALLSQ